MLEKPSPDMEISTTGTILSFASLSVGALHGFFDAKGIPLKPNAEFVLTYGPAIMLGTTGAVDAGINEIFGEKRDWFGAQLKESKLERIARNTTMPKEFLRTSGRISYGGILYSLYGGALTLVGYGTGYLAGMIF